MDKQSVKQLRKKVERSKLQTAKLVVPSVLDVSGTISLCDIQSRYREKVRATMSKRAKTARPQLLSYEERISIQGPSTNMRKFAEKCIVPKMSRFLEKKIRKRIGIPRLQMLHSKAMESFMSEVREEFLSITHQTGVEMKVKIQKDKKHELKIQPYKYLGKTENYPQYLRTRKKVMKVFILHCPLVTKIVSECVTNLPECLFNLSAVNSHPLSIADLGETVHNKISDASQFLKDFYRKITVLLDDDFIPLRKADLDLPRYYGACTGLMSIYLSRSIANTMKNVLEFTSPHKLKPYLIMSIAFEGKAILTPNQQELVDLFISFVNELLEVGNQFHVLQRLKLRGYENKHIYLCITEEFIKKCIENIKEHIEKSYKPVLEFLHELNSQYQEVCDDVSLGENKYFSDIQFEDGYSKIMFYKKFLFNIFHVPSREYFSIGQVVLIDYVDFLSSGLKLLMDNIFKKLALQHEYEVSDIHEAFRLINFRARKKSKTTEELVEIGRYMIWVREEFFAQLTERVQNSLSDLIKLINLGPLSERHMHLNCAIKNWLDRLPPILEQYFADYDQLKFEAEENLQTVIEEVTESVKKVYPLLDILNNMDDIASVKKYLKQINLHMIRIKQIENQISWINQEEVCLSFPKSTYGEYDSLKDFVHPFYHLIKLCSDVQCSIHVWEDGQLDFICYETTNRKLEQYEAELTELQKTYRNRLRQAQEDSTAIKFKGTVDDPDILNWPAPLKLCGKGLQLINKFKPALKIIRIMCNPALKKRHWLEMSGIAGFSMQPDAGTTLRRLMSIDYGSNFDKYVVISESATKEAQLIAQLDAMEEMWLSIDFSVIIHPNTGYKILHDFQNLQEKVDDNDIQITNMKHSVYVKPYKDTVDNFDDRIQTISRTLKECSIVQDIWLDFCPIFLENNLADKISYTANLFSKVDTTYKMYMEAIAVKPNVMECISDGKFLEELLDCKKNLEMVRCGLREYIEEIRVYFPRFYFLSDDELILLLSKTDNMCQLEPYLNKLFPSVTQLVYHESEVYGIRSEEKEEIILETIDINKAEGLVEVWLKSLEERIFTTIKRSIHECFREYTGSILESWIDSWPGHILLIILKINWTIDVQKALKDKKFDDVSRGLDKDIQTLSAIIKAKSQQNLVKFKVQSLLIDAIHRKTVTSELIQKGIQDENEFIWLAQLRYYLEGDKCYVKLLYASIIYGNEYINNSGRLVVTPLTERCYRTLFSSYHMHLYASPVGPAGTGKTETVKDLAKSLGVLCIVFSCSDKMEYKTLLRFIKGIASCGCWLALDEFNRITTEVLSVISQTICSLQLGVKSRCSTISIDKSQILLSPACFVCITMNPGYPGRSVLPENLKVLFRNVSMMTPDSIKIAEVSLVSSGFENARPLSQKLVSALKFMAEMFSSERHYDFGIRTLKSILSECEKSLLMQDNNTEESIIVTSLRTVLLSRTLPEDKLIFESILKDTFTTLMSISPMKGSFGKVALECCKQNNIQLTDVLYHKICETWEGLRARKGIIIVGHPDSGKTTVIKMLARILELEFRSNEMKSEITCAIVNPKSVSLNHLYGEYDGNLQRWSDGIVSKYFRRWSQTADKFNFGWMVFDGPIDTVWVENLNSVLDDNSKLCLSSGEIINVNEFLSVIFEVIELKGASPATVSRCGVIYVESSQDNWRYIVQSWINTREEEWYIAENEYINSLLNWIIPGSMKISRTLQNIYYISELVLVRTTLMLFRSYLDDALGSNYKKEEDSKNLRSWIQASLIQACIWGFLPGSNLDLIAKFDESFRFLWKGQDSDFPYPQSVEKMDVGLPLDSSVYDSAYIYKQKGNWKNWSDLIKNENISESLISTGILFPTIDTARYSAMLRMSIRNSSPVLFVGPTGSGKTLIIQDFLLNKLKNDSLETGTISLTSDITINELQQRILKKLNRIKSGYYAPLQGKSYILFVDDLHVPNPDQYGIQIVLELLRQHLDHNIWYDMNTLESLHLARITLVAALSQYEFISMNPRLLRHFSIFFLYEIPQDICSKIYSGVLFNCWRHAGFPVDILSTVNQITLATCQFYNELRMRLKPSLEHYLYQFNLFDYHRVIQGCIMLKKDTADADKKIFPKIWVHELLRVIGDRITNCKHKLWLVQSLNRIMENIFRENFSQVFENLPQNEEGLPRFNDLSKLFFLTKFDKVPEKENITYEEVTVLTIKESLSSFIVEYNDTHELKLEIVLFESVITNVMKIAHILSMSKRNALIIGVSGIGRKTASMLAALLVRQKLVQPTVTERSSGYEWRKEMKTAIIDAGAKAMQSVVLIDEYLFDRDVLFNDIDFMLKADDLQIIFDSSEQQTILDETRSRVKIQNISLDLDASAVFLYFNKCYKENMHILLCISPDANLRRALQRYPSLSKYCDKIVLETWPTESFQHVADIWLESVDLDEQAKRNVKSGFQFIHDYSEILSRKYYDEVRIQNYITTTSYLQLVSTYTKVITEKQNDLSSLKKRYDIGLDKLSFAATQIAKMQQALSEYQPQLEEMTRRAKEMTEEIATETIEVEKASALVRIDEKIANEQAIAANLLKLDCEADLAQAIPILEDAITALNTLKPSDITLVKSMKNPPDAIKLVMAAVCVIKDVKPDRIPDPSTGRKIVDYWSPSKRILGDMNFLQTLKDFDKDHIKPEIMAKIRKEYLPHKDFAPHIVAKASSAAEGLCKWIIAMDMYDKVAKEVAPKKEKLEKAEREYAQTLAILNEKKEEVARIEEKLATLNSLLEEARKKQQILQREVDLCNRRLERAQRLIRGLGGEKERWENISNKLQGHFSDLAGDILISSGIIAYLAPFPNEFRKDAITNWYTFLRANSISCSFDFDFTQILGSEAVVQGWHINNLPLDSFFVENAIIYSQATRWPLFLDPQFLAKHWIQSTEKNNDLSVIRMSENNMIENIKTNMKLGKPMLLEGIKNDIHTSLEPILLKRIIKRKDVYYVNLYGNEEEYNPDFRLYLTCYSKNAQFKPAIFTRVCIINFGLTVTSLTKILSNSVVGMEHPVKHQTEQSLNIKIFENGKELKFIEEKILQTLSESKSDILEDEKALKILDQSKDISNNIRAQQEDVKLKLIEIEVFKRGFFQIAEQAAVVFDVVSELYKINIMYQYSLDWFLNIIIQSVQLAERSRDHLKRVLILKEKITQDIFTNISKSLYISDRTPFGFYLCVKLEMFNSRVTAEEISFFCEEMQFRTPPISDRAFECIPDACNERISKLIEFDESFVNLRRSITEKPQVFKDLFFDYELDDLTLPFKWYEELPDFSKLLVISTLRPDKISATVNRFIKGVLGENYIEPIHFDISQAYNQSSALCPLIFLLSIDTDPVGVVLQFAKVKNMLHKLHSISLGNCQKNRVLELITQGQREGLWICLENCHLAYSWISHLETVFVEMTYENTHENFRLWMTTSESEEFPVFLLQNGVKIVNQSPPGIRQNLLKTYMQHPVNDTKFFHDCPRRPDSFARLLYSLAFFHAVIEERKGFGPIGWNIPYEFKQIDFNLAAKHLQIFLDQYDNPFRSLLYLIGECDYGGRVSDDWDQRLFNIILNDFLSKDIENSSANVFSSAQCKYGFPKKNDYLDYLEAMKELPDYDPPEVFGLHNNMEKIRSSNESVALLAKLTRLTARNKNERDTSSNITEDIIENILFKLPEFPSIQFTEDDLHKRILFREIKFYQRLYLHIKTTLQDTLKGIRGEVYLSDELQCVAESLLKHKIPESWNNLSYSTIYSLENYLVDFWKRLNYLSEWSQDLNFKHIWFPFIVYPTAFLAIVKQDFSRNTGISLEKIKFSFHMNGSYQSFQEDTKISGLFMEGARWNKKKNCIDELLPGMLFDAMPEIILKLQTEESLVRKCRVPVYRTSERRGEISTSGHSSNYIFSMFLNSAEDTSHWVKRSIALVCQVRSYD